MSLKAGDAGYDPFSRRWTRSRNYYVTKAVDRNEAVEGTADKDTAAALEAAADAEKLVDTNAPMDRGTKSNMLHNLSCQYPWPRFRSLVDPRVLSLDTWLDRSNNWLQSFRG